jgi:uncharacterized protein YceK
LKGGLLVVLAVALSFSGCETIRNFSQERYSRNNEIGHAWLSDQILPPDINISGSWRSRDWGDTFFSQADRTVRGNLGNYPVVGVVSGSKAYLLASTGGGWFQYSVILEMPGSNVLIGYYSRSIPYRSSNRRNVRLDRVGPPLPGPS